MKVKSFSRVRLLAIPWTAAHQAPPSMGFSRQEYWNGFPLLSPPSALRESLFESFPATSHPGSFTFFCCSTSRQAELILAGKILSLILFSFSITAPVCRHLLPNRWCVCVGGVGEVGWWQWVGHLETSEMALHDLLIIRL